MSAKAVILNGLLPPDYDSHGKRLVFDVASMNEQRAQLPKFQVTMNDARLLQAKASSDLEFFEKNGFVLLHAPTHVRDWKADLGTVFYSEVEAIIREKLLPGQPMCVLQVRDATVIRGAGTKDDYGMGVHADFGWPKEDLPNNLRATTNPIIASAFNILRNLPFISRTCILNFWRTADMNEPLQHKPLALCLNSSLNEKDFVQAGFRYPNGKVVNCMCLRYNPEQQWCYYPQMTPDEVLVFKSLDYSEKNSRYANWRAVFHTAFIDPDADENCSPRRSIDHRPTVLVFRKIDSTFLVFRTGLALCCFTCLMYFFSCVSSPDTWRTFSGN